MSELISTIITTYRRPHLLKRAIASVLKQTYTHFQVYIYDNASDDETEKIVREFMKQDSRVKYHRHLENIGMMGNYQYAFDQIATPYFSFLSDDDFFLPCFFEEALKGFQEFPDAAFSACGICQMDEKGNFIGDPLSRWDSEGYFSAPYGLFEMICKNHRFPVPTGILFQNKCLKDVKPNFTKDIQLLWDPDYLIRIAAKYPIVIRKKTCGIYLAHSESFANAFYCELLKNKEKIEEYLLATKTILTGIQNNSFTNSFDRKKATKYFSKYIVTDVTLFIKIYITKNEYGAAHFLAKRYYSHFGYSLTILLHHLLAIFFKCHKTVKKIIRKLFSIRSILFPKKPVPNPISSDEMKKHYNYGQELLKQ